MNFKFIFYALFSLFLINLKTMKRDRNERKILMNYRFFPSIIRFEKQKLIIDIGHMTDGEFYYYYYYQKLKDMDLYIINTNILLKIRKKERERI